MVYLGVTGEGGGAAPARFRVLSGPLERLRGLLLTGPSAEPVVILRCRSIHTMGMAYRIDVAFVSESGRVVAARREVPPGRLIAHRDAFCVFERPSSQGAWFSVGERVRASSVERTTRAGATTRDDGAPATREGDATGGDGAPATGAVRVRRPARAVFARGWGEER